MYDDFRIMLGIDHWFLDVRMTEDGRKWRVVGKGLLPVPYQLMHVEQWFFSYEKGCWLPTEQDSVPAG